MNEILIGLKYFLLYLVKTIPLVSFFKIKGGKSIG